MTLMFMGTKDGNPAKNQQVFATDKGQYLESYGDVVAFSPKMGGPIKLGPKYDYSETTIYYVVKFLGMGLPAIREGIARGEIHVVPHGLQVI